jgi:hypothetical protein
MPGDTYSGKPKGVNMYHLMRLNWRDNFKKQQLTDNPKPPAAALGLPKILNRPAVFSIPGFVLKLVLGEAAVLLTESPEVEPKNLLEAGVEFKYPNIELAFKEITG